MKSIGSSLSEKTADAECTTHGPYTAQVIVLHDRTLLSPCPRCGEERNRQQQEQERANQERQRSERIRVLLARSGIPERFRSRTLDNYRAESEAQQRALQIAMVYADRFEDRLKHGGGLVFCGKPGTGKTHLACAIASRVIQTGRSAVFVSVLRAIRSVKDTYRKDSTMSEQDAINALLNPDLLVLDEVGVQFGSDAEKMILFEIMNGRYEAIKPTVVCSNLAREDLAAYIGERVLDRLQEGGGAVVAFDWESYRPHVHKDDALPVAEVKPVSWSYGRVV